MAFDTINKGKEHLKQLWDEHEFLSEIDKIKEAINKMADKITADELSRSIYRLSVLLVNLGGLVAEVSCQANENYVYRKYRFLWEFNMLNPEMTTKNRENIALDKIHANYCNELVSRFVADFLKAYKDDINTLISVIQTRLSYLKSEMINLKSTY